MNAENPANLQPLLEQIDRLKAEIEQLRPLSPEQEARVMQKFRLDWNYHSNSIEGNSLTYGETIAFLLEGLTAKGKPFKDHLDIKGHNEGIDYLMEIIKNRQQLTEKTIRELHKIILVEPYKTPARTPDGQAAEKTVHLGQYKSLPNHVKTPTGEIHYYATPEETPAKMSDLMAWLKEHQEKEDLHPLILAAIFHYRFVAIHPFDDGNGRMSRLLMNLLLMHYRYPPVVIKQQERNAYYYALRQADAGDLSPFIEFIGENLIHSMEIYLRGARGESIEDVDDLDKEIALLKGSLGGREEVIKLNEQVFDEHFFKVLYPLFSDIKLQCSKFNDLFSSNWLKINIVGVDKELKIGFKQLEDIENNVKWEVERPKFSASSIKSCSFIVHWEHFKKNNPPFNVHRWIQVQFGEFNYILHSKDEDDIQIFEIEKNYLQSFSEKEKREIISAFTKSILDEIKRNTGT